MAKQATHLIIGLGKGGAETMLYQVLKYQSNPEIRHKVISFGVSHYFEKPIEELGVPLVELSLRKRPISSLIRAYKEIKGTDTLCCWMYHSNLIGYYLGKLARVKRIVWGVHHSNLSPELNSKLLLWTNRRCAKISRKVDLISYTGERSRRLHEEHGYCKERGLVLVNGCDCSDYYPDKTAGEQLRRELGIDNEEKIVLSVTKDTVIKDIPTFIRAFGTLCRKRSDLVAVLCGSGVTPQNEKLTALCEKENLIIGKQIFLLGLRQDVSRLLAGCDFYVLHSAGEAFPVTLVEAMSCGCICVTTDVGDARATLNDDRFVVTPQQPQEMADVIERAVSLSSEEQSEISGNNRKRVLENFEIRRVVGKYEEMFR